MPRKMHASLGHGSTEAVMRVGWQEEKNNKKTKNTMDKWEVNGKAD